MTESEIPSLDGPVALVDLAGDTDVVAAVHRRLGDRLTRSVIVAGPIGTPPATAASSPGPRPRCSSPERVRALAARIGGASLLHRMDTAMREFVAASPWLRIVEHVGPDALQDVLGTVVAGRALPEDVHIIRPA